MSFRQVKSVLSKTSSPADECWPVGLDEITRFLDLGDTTTEDDKLLDLLPGAIEMVERHTQRALVEQTWKLYMDYFPCSTIELRIAPVQSITSITYVSNDTTQTLSADDYYSDLVSEPARIIPMNDWPQVDDEPNAVIVEFVAGYTILPRAAWTAVMLAIKAAYYGCDVKEAYWNAIGQLRWEGGL